LWDEQCKWNCEWDGNVLIFTVGGHDGAMVEAKHSEKFKECVEVMVANLE